LSAAPAIVVTATSGNNALLPSTNLVLTSDNIGNWALKATPAPDQVGSTPLTFTARNEAGLTATQAVLVFVVSPQPLPGQVLNSTNLEWSTWGFAPWFSENTITHDGVSAAQSGAIADLQESWLGTLITGPGRLTYWWKVSSE